MHAYGRKIVPETLLHILAQHRFERRARAGEDMAYACRSRIPVAGPL
jgi:hypothetical protein